MMEAQEKLICEHCGETCETPLYAANPFCPTDDLTGCPHCYQAECLEQACQIDGCKNKASAGQPNWRGFRYIWLCHAHSVTP